MLFLFWGKCQFPSDQIIIIISFWSPNNMPLNPRTYTQIHTLTVVQGGLGGGWLNKMRYILWVLVLLEACDVTNNGRHLGVYQELEITLKPREIVIFCALHETLHINKHFP